MHFPFAAHRTGVVAAGLAACVALACAHAGEPPCPCSAVEPPAPGVEAPAPGVEPPAAVVEPPTAVVEPPAPVAQPPAPIAQPPAAPDPAAQASPVPMAAPPAALSPAPDPVPACGGAPGAKPPAFHWPARGHITSPFGMRRGAPHEGIDISSRGGFDVRAAAAGRVAFSGRKHGYGRVILLEHAGGYKTVYAHNQDNLVLEGARVKQGAVIADMGRTGEASGPHLHFEIRAGERPLDPLACLPARAKGR